MLKILKMLKGLSKRLLQISLVVLFLLSANSCQKDQQTLIPYVTVDFYINLATHNDLTTPSNYEVFPYGYTGIIVINNGDGYYAFDTCCPYEVKGSCTVTPDASGIATCSCCGSQYSLMGGGYPIKGPSVQNLQMYKVTPTGGRLWVHN